MSFLFWLRDGTPISTHGGRSTHLARRKPASFRPRLENLEGRDVPSTLTVTNNLDTGLTGDGSLRGEIAAAKSGDTIVFDPSLSGQTINLYDNGIGGEMVINKNLTIHGPSAPLTPVTISGLGLSRVFEVDGASTVVSLSNLNFIDGTGISYTSSGGAPYGQGGAIWNGGTLTVNGCNLSNNSAINSSLGLGGAIYNAGTLTVSNSTLNNNSVYLSNWDHTYVGDGGAIYNVGTLAVSNSTLDGNIATHSGGGADGGGIFNASGASATITGSSFSGNFAFDGGGIFNAYRASATVTGSSFTGNFTFDGYVDGYYFIPVAGGIYNGGVLTLSGSTVSGNSGGIFNDKKSHLVIASKSRVVNNGTDLYNLASVKISTDSDVGVIVN